MYQAVSNHFSPFSPARFHRIQQPPPARSDITRVSNRFGNPHPNPERPARTLRALQSRWEPVRGGRADEGGHLGCGRGQGDDERDGGGSEGGRGG